MRIKNININNFGKLSDCRINPSEGLNIIYAPNESGKTSLMSFVKYIFYGTKQKKQSGDMTFKERYTPWSGLAMGGSLEIETKEGNFILQRTENNNSSKLSVFNLSSGEKEDNIQNAGIYFMGMGEKAFSNSAYISDIHSIHSSSDEGEILSHLLDSSSNKKTYTRIRDGLNERYLQITSPKRKNSSLSVTDGEIRQTEDKLRTCERNIEIYSKKISDADKTQNRINILSKEQNKLIALQKYSEYINLGSKLGTGADADIKPGDNKKFILPLALVFTIFSLLLFSFAKISALYTVFGAVSSVSALLLYILSYSSFLIKKTVKEQQGIIADSILKYEKQLEIIKNELNMPIDEIKSFTNRDIDGIIKDNEEEIKELRVELGMARRNAEKLREFCIEKEALLGEIRRLGEKRKEYLYEAEIISLALDILNSAFADVKDDVFPILCRKTLEIYSYVTNSPLEHISSDESFGISYLKDGFVRSASYLSKGSADILYFSLRLAVIDSLSGGSERIPIFIDDAFSSCDDERTERLLDLILKMSEKNQIFLMSCRSREGEYFKNNDKVKIFNGLKG